MDRHGPRAASDVQSNESSAERLAVERPATVARIWRSTLSPVCSNRWLGCLACGAADRGAKMSLFRRKVVPDVPMQRPGTIDLPLPDHDVLGGHRRGLLPAGLNRQGDRPYFVGKTATPAHINGGQRHTQNPA